MIRVMKWCACVCVLCVLAPELSPLASAIYGPGELAYSDFGLDSQIELGSEYIDRVVDLDSALKEIRRAAEDSHNTNSPLDDKAIRDDAEAAVSRAASQEVSDDTLQINAALLEQRLNDPVRDYTTKAEEELKGLNIPIQNGLKRTVTFLWKYRKNWAVSVSFDPDISQVKPQEGEEVYIRLEIKDTCALTLSLAGLQHDLKDAVAPANLQFSEPQEEDRDEMQYGAECIVESDSILRHPITLSLALSDASVENRESLSVIDRRSSKEDNTLRDKHYNVNMMDATLNDYELSWGSLVNPNRTFPDLDEEVKNGTRDKVVREAVYKLVSVGILKGYADGTFRAGDNISRQVFARYITQVVPGAYDPYAVCSFSDVDTNSDFYTDIASAAKNKYVNGFSDGRFKPKNTINMQQMYKIVGCAMEEFHGRNPDTFKYKSDDGQDALAYLKVAKGFSDADRITDNMRDHIAYAAEYELIIRRPNQRFGNPQDIVNRGDAAVVLYKLYNLVH